MIQTVVSFTQIDSSNYWKLTITPQNIIARAGVTVTQGSATGTLAASLDGTTSCLEVKAAVGVSFDTTEDVVIKTAEAKRPSSAYCPPEMARIIFDKETKHWLPPFMRNKEKLNKNELKVSEKHDSWSFGVILYELCQGKKLFKMNNNDDIDKTDEHTQDKLCKWTSYDIDEALSDLDPAFELAEDLIYQCLQEDPKDRPSMKEILNHIFLTGKDKSTENEYWTDRGDQKPKRYKFIVARIFLYLSIFAFTLVSIHIELWVWPFNTMDTIGTVVNVTKVEIARNMTEQLPIINVSAAIIGNKIEFDSSIKIWTENATQIMNMLRDSINSDLNIDTSSSNGYRELFFAVSLIMCSILAMIFMASGRNYKNKCNTKCNTNFSTQAYAPKGLGKWALYVNVGCFVLFCFAYLLDNLDFLKDTYFEPVHRVFTPVLNVYSELEWKNTTIEMPYPQDYYKNKLQRAMKKVTKSLSKDTNVEGYGQLALPFIANFVVDSEGAGWLGMFIEIAGTLLTQFYTLFVTLWISKWGKKCKKEFLVVIFYYTCTQN